MREEVVVLRGAKTGPTSIVLGGVHGDETCGVNALTTLLPTLSIERGTVYVAYGNPRAIALNKRFTETNLNRMFKNDVSNADKTSYEYDRAKFLKTYLNKAGALLDVHASFTPESTRFAICEPNARGIVEYLPVDLVVSGFDAIEPGGTDYYMNKIGKIGICVECGYLGDPDSNRIATESIVQFLIARGHINGVPMRRSQSSVRIHSLYLSKTDFTLVKSFKDFEKIAKDELIGFDGTKEIRAPEDSVILFARNVSANDEAFLLGTWNSF